MDSAAIANVRLWNQRISGNPFATPQQVVRWLGAMQSQEYGVATWSIGQRMNGASAAALDEALADGTILRTHMLRPTWHFVAPADVRWMQELTAPRVHAVSAYWYRRFGIDDALAARFNALVTAALAGGHELTRKEIAALLGQHGIVAEGLRMGNLLMRAELDLVLCSGGLKGKQHTYALLDERAPQAESLPRDEALAELTKRYFTSHGPATVKDYVWWSGLTTADARRGLQLVQPQLEHIVMDDRTYWFGEGRAAADVATPTAHLLQGYDEFIIAYSESRDALDRAGLAGVVPAGAAMLTHALVLDGQVLGHWRRSVPTKAVTITVQLARPLAAPERDALSAAVDRYGAFVGKPATWSQQ